jgi:hypothetical protein
LEIFAHGLLPPVLFVVQSLGSLLSIVYIMVFGFYWVCVMFLALVGFLFIASFGLNIDIAFYEKSDNLVCSYE